MRDGTRLAVTSIVRKRQVVYPVVYASALHNKDIQVRHRGHIAAQPAHAPLWFGPIEAADTRRSIAKR